MNSERQILRRLIEGCEEEYNPDKRDEDLDEAGFEAGGKVYKCAFGNYTCDGEPISREDYFAAKKGNGGGSSSDVSKSEPSKKPDAPAKKEEPKKSVEDLEAQRQEIKNKAGWRIGLAGLKDDDLSKYFSLSKEIRKIKGNSPSVVTDNSGNISIRSSDPGKFVKTTKSEKAVLDKLDSVVDGIAMEDATKYKGVVSRYFYHEDIEDVKTRLSRSFGDPEPKDTKGTSSSEILSYKAGNYTINLRVPDRNYKSHRPSISVTK